MIDPNNLAECRRLVEQIEDESNEATNAAIHRALNGGNPLSAGVGWSQVRHPSMAKYNLERAKELRENLKRVLERRAMARRKGCTNSK